MTILTRVILPKIPKLLEPQTIIRFVLYGKILHDL